MEVDVVLRMISLHLTYLYVLKISITSLLFFYTHIEVFMYEFYRILYMANVTLCRSKSANVTLVHFTC